MNYVKKKKSLLSFIDWLVHMIAYGLILILTSYIFKNTVYIQSWMWGFIAAIIIYLLNKTVKPLVFWLTLPITGLTFGLFYIFINVATLKLVQYITVNHFIITGYIMPFIVACFISIMNILIDELVINKFKKRG